jgi:hypothetical protein
MTAQEELVTALAEFVGKPLTNLGENRGDESQVQVVALDQLMQQVEAEFIAADADEREAARSHAMIVRRYGMIIILAILVAAAMSGIGRASMGSAAIGSGAAAALAVFGKRWLGFEETLLANAASARNRSAARAAIKILRSQARISKDAGALKVAAQELLDTFNNAPEKPSARTRARGRGHGKNSVNRQEKAMESS